MELAARPGAGGRHHRHRRRRQVQRDRRAAGRFLASFPERRIAVLAVDPTRRRTGGALLGDRIRMNSLRSVAHVHALDGHAAPARGHQ
jgi:putative protein kinase ArgK-like GTPase of G3E family